MWPLLAWLLVSPAVAQEDANGTKPLPRIVLARKHIARDALIVEGKQLIISYDVYNVGDMAAVDVTVTDAINLQWFEIVEGDSNARIAELAPQSRRAWNLTVVPKTSGSIVIDRAVVEYTIGDQTKRMVSSSSLAASCVHALFVLTVGTHRPGRLQVTSAGAYLRATSYYLKEWLLFALVTAVPTALPAAYYFAYK